MPHLTATKVFTFCYGHHLPGYDGKCRNFHGHNARLEVEVRQPTVTEPNHYPGMVMDFGTIKAKVKPVLEELDHKDVTPILAEQGLNPTCENMVQWLWKRLNQELDGCVERLRLTETDTAWAEIRR
jgi:6-pyruvoyltetrahydropterin/6-carboxytetrahydropterin synthase